MKRILTLAILFPVLALGGVTRNEVTTDRISRASTARYVYTMPTSVASIASGPALSTYSPVAGTLVDLIIYQSAAGTTGTSVSLSITKAIGGTALFTTPAVVTRASGADVLVDAKGDLALPSGWTRPVIDGSVTVTKGQKLFINTTETGSYGTHPSFVLVLVFEGRQ